MSKRSRTSGSIDTLYKRSPADDDWQAAHDYTRQHFDLAREVLSEVRQGVEVSKAIRRYPLPEGGFLSKDILVKTYRSLTDSGEWPFENGFLRQIRMKPSRTLSGVTTVTVLTKPYPCPGKCVFCPTDARMPKSYLADEPGAMRALHHEFDPFMQTASRLEALHNIGHPTDKIELLILGGTWSSYKRDYQVWFIRRCLEALNGSPAETLSEAQAMNEESDHRNVGLVIETRPDHIDVDEIKWLRSLGVTKVQLGAQSFDDRILALNQRGHSAAETGRAVRMLRAAGFKIVLHWMPNLLGASLESDRADFMKLWDERDYRPDEIKIYPCQLLENAELFAIWQSGGYQPYTTEELVDLIADIKPAIPQYCRVNRIVRDIPSTNVVEGNRRTSLRQDIHKEMEARGERCRCIRCREIRGEKVTAAQLQLVDQVYAAGAAEEHFLSFMTREDRLAGYLRLSLPRHESPALQIPEIEGAALVREVHVYGQSLQLGQTRSGAAQHLGLGTSLMEKAEAIARESGFARMAVISALGTRAYYRKLGYELAGTYMVKDL